MNITEKAMLVKQSTSFWRARVRDGVAEKEVQAKHHNDDDMGAFLKRLLPAEAMAEGRAILSQAKAHHYANTLPWEDQSYRLLPSSNYFEYVNKQREYAAQLAAWVESFLPQYPRWVEEAKRKLNGLFDASEYPSAETLRNKFTINIGFMPIPDAGDFRVALSKDEESAVRDSIKHEIESKIEEATGDLWARLAKAVSHMQGIVGDENRRIFESVISNMRDLVSTASRLNVTGSKVLAQTLKEIDNKLCAHTADVLKNDPALRAKTAADAEAILKKMAGYCGK